MLPAPYPPTFNPYPLPLTLTLTLPQAMLLEELNNVRSQMEPYP